MKYSCAFLLAVVCLGGCSVQKSSPTAPDLGSASGLSAGQSPSSPATAWPTDGPGVIAFVSARYPDKLAGGISQAERIANMQFLRDRIIEAGKCGGMDLGWNLKRGGPEVSNDFITERVNGNVIGHDIALDYDNPDHPLQLVWGGGDYPTYKEYPAPSCQ